MMLKTFVPAALLFLLPWLLFGVGGIPDIAPYVKGPVLVGVVSLMIASPLLTVLFVGRALRRAGKPSQPATLVVGVLAILVNCPVILLVLFISLYDAAP